MATHLVELTLLSGDPIQLSTDHIIWVIPRGNGSTIFMDVVESFSTVPVIEDPEEIRTLVNGGDDEEGELLTLDKDSLTLDSSITIDQTEFTP